MAAAYLLLHAVVPLSWILLGSSYTDLLHGTYLLWYLLYCTYGAVRLAPAPCPAPWAPVGACAAPPAHRVLRFYASVHLLALYVAMCGQLPGLRRLQRPEWQQVLELVGLWDPSLASDCLPLLATLMLATVHAVLGKSLTAQAASANELQAPLPAAPAVSSSAAAAVPADASPPVAPWLLHLAKWVGNAVVSDGTLMIAAVQFAAVLYDTGQGAVGAGYIVIGSLLVLLPPRRRDYASALQLQFKR